MGTAGRVPELPDIMTNWHHNLHLEIVPLMVSDISAEMLSAQVNTCQNLHDSCTRVLFESHIKAALDPLCKNILTYPFAIKTHFWFSVELKAMRVQCSCCMQPRQVLMSESNASKHALFHR